MMQITSCFMIDELHILIPHVLVDVLCFHPSDRHGMFPIQIPPHLPSSETACSRLIPNFLRIYVSRPENRSFGWVFLGSLVSQCIFQACKPALYILCIWNLLQPRNMCSCSVGCHDSPRIYVVLWGVWSNDRCTPSVRVRHVQKWSSKWGFIFGGENTVNTKAWFKKKMQHVEVSQEASQ